MKKVYEKPVMQVVQIQHAEMLMSSTDSVRSVRGTVNYGGSDANYNYDDYGAR